MKQIQYNRRNYLLLSLLLFISFTTGIYNNCSKVSFNQDLSSLNSVQSKHTAYEDEALRAEISKTDIYNYFDQSSITLKFEITRQPMYGTITNFSTDVGTFIYTGSANFFGEDYFDVNVQLTNTQTGKIVNFSRKETIQVLPVNDTPVILTQNFTLSQDTQTEFTVQSTDIENDPLTYQTLSVSAQGAVSFIGNKLVYTPKCGFSGTENIQIKVSDNHGATAQSIVQAQVTAGSNLITLSRSINEDSTLNDSLSSLLNRCLPAAGTGNVLRLLGSPSNGAVSNIQPTALTYTYTPRANFFGSETLQFEVSNGSYVKNVTVNVNVQPVNDLPVLNASTFEVYYNTSVTLTPNITDPDDINPILKLNASDAVSITTPLGGTLQKISATVFKYSAPHGIFDKTDIVNVFLSDSSLQNFSAQLKFNIVRNPIVELKPALAVRGMTCTMCHAQINANVITDFGHGEAYATVHANEPTLAPYVDQNIDIYHLDVLTRPNYTVLDTIKAWQSGRISQQIYVPNKVGPSVMTAGLSYVAYLQSLSVKSYQICSQRMPGSSTIDQGVLCGASMAPLQSAVNPVGFNNIYIGAPTVADINSLFTTSQNLEIQGSLSGLQPVTGNNGVIFYSNSGQIRCEGDILLKTTLLLNNANILTKNGCRIYSTKSVLIQNQLLINSPDGVATNSQLQISSAGAILLGIGDEAYNIRRINYSLPTRGGDLLSLVDAERSNLGSRIEDATLHNSRNISFSRLLLNAPQVHSRYVGNFSGTIIAEIAVMSPGQFTFTFDNTFISPGVEILPLLNGSKILVAK